MIGGPPVFMPATPSMPNSLPRQGAPAGNYTPPRLAAPTRARQPEAPPAQPAPRVARGLRGSEPARSPLAIPTPEELGVASSRQPASSARPAETLDWSAARRQLAEVGAVRFGLENLPGGKVRFSCWLPGNSDSPVVVQADGATEVEAVRDCLEQARGRMARKQ